ncbi:MAG TPA: DUF2752 domain-containing protein [Bacteroidales bacterium]|nr:DUF2752 domain-containing protein [Bacteroidales bacterium]
MNLADKIRVSLREPYIFINTVFAGVILMVFLYSIIFSPEKNSYPLVCIHEKLTGEPCVSCGLSHSFSLILRGRVAEAQQWNIYGLRVFLFFAAQLVMRIYFSVLYAGLLPGIRRNLILYDISGSLIIFLLSFSQFLRWIV